MKIHEYQGKEILRQFGVPVPRGIPAFTVQEAVEAAQKLGGPVWVVKAQIHAGGRGKGGGVKVAKTIDDVKKLAGQILGMQLKTHQTGPEGQTCGAPAHQVGGASTRATNDSELVPMYWSMPKNANGMTSNPMMTEAIQPLVLSRKL